MKRRNTRKDPKDKQFNVRLTVGQMEELRRGAFDHNVSISRLVCELLIAQGVISPSVKLFS